MPKLQLSVNEIVAYLKRTFLPTVLVEGTDDKEVYRHIERKLCHLEIDILVCGGREALLEIFSRKNEYSSSQVVFVADKDMWYFTDIPTKYKNEIIFSHGYSIENDLYVQHIFEGLLEKEEETEFRQLIRELSRWFSFEVSRYRDYGYSMCDIHINQVTNSNSLCDEYMSQIGFIEPDPDLVAQVISTYTSALRGKNLFQAILRFLSSSKRKSKYSRHNLIELGAKSANEHIEKLYRQIEDKFQYAQQAH